MNIVRNERNFRDMTIKRIIAFVIEGILVFLIVGFCLFIGSDMKEQLLMPSITGFKWYGVLLSLLAFFVLPFFRDLPFGVSPGKLVMGLRVMDKITEEKASVPKLILRNITFYIPQIEFIVLLATRGRTLGDMISKTTVENRRKKEM